MVLAEKVQAIIRTQTGIPPGAEALISLALSITPWNGEKWSIPNKLMRAIGNVVRDDLESGNIRKAGARDLVGYADILARGLNSVFMDSHLADLYSDEVRIRKGMENGGYVWNGKGFEKWKAQNG